MQNIPLGGVVRDLYGIADIAGGRAGAGPEPVRLIFDTDICGDCDDVLALGMIHSLQSRGLCRLLAVTISVDHDQAAPFVDAVNTFYGRGTIPIGVVGKGGVVEKSEFLSLVDEKDRTATSAIPTACSRALRLPSATAVLRETLAAQPDRSVVIAQVGFSTNLARLLDSPPDEHSPLSGRELVQQEGQVALTDGRRISTDRRQHPLSGIQRHQGHHQRPGAGRALADADGLQRVRDRHRAALPGDQHRARLRLCDAPSAGRGLHPPYPAAAQPADLGPDQRAVRGPARSRLFRPLAARKVTVEPDGFTRFEPSPEGKHRYLILRPEQRLRTLEALVQLSSQPPVGLRQ